MQGQSQRGGLRGGRRGFGGPPGGGGNKQDKSTGPGGMTPGPGPGGAMVAGATPPGLGQSVAQGGTTAGFAGGPTPGGGGGQSLQDLFAAQQPLAQGIGTLTDQDIMQTLNEMTFGPLDSPSFTAFETFRNIPLDFIDFGFPPSEDDTSSFESGESVIDNLRAILDPQFNVGIGTLGVDVDPRGFINNNPNIGFNLSVPLN